MIFFLVFVSREPCVVRRRVIEVDNAQDKCKAVNHTQQTTQIKPRDLF